MLGFGKTQAASLTELLAKKKFGKAVELIRDELRTRGRDPRLRMQLADVLQRAGRGPEAIPILLELADEFALVGSAAKAIATLKRAQGIAPGQPEIEEHLAYLIAQQKAPTPDPWLRARAGVGAGPESPFLGDMEEIGAETGGELPNAAPAPEVRDEVPPRTSQPKDAPDAPAGSGGEPEFPLEDVALPDDPAGDTGGLDGFADEVLALVDDVVSGRFTPETPAMAAVPAVETPLFRDFSCDELVEVIRGLRLRTFAAGEIIVSEGEAGNSLFVLTTGTVRTYVRDGNGHSNPVRVLREGDFFGEVSLLESEVRTATITAASRCDLLEIDKETLDGIARTKPRIWDVVRRFYQARADSDAERSARAGQAVRS